MKRIKRMFPAAAACLRRIVSPLQGKWGRIAYYGGVLVALCALAAGAEAHRQKQALPAQELVLPAVELSQVEEVKPQLVFRIPDGMRLLREYSELPDWNSQLGQWESHAAVDCSFPEDRVTALCDGEVVSIGRSGVCGGFVELKCGDYLLRYASLDPVEELAEGMWLRAGETIGTAQNAVLCEMELGAHLHLEIYRGEKSLDLEELCGKIPPAAD